MKDLAPFVSDTLFESLKTARPQVALTALLQERSSAQPKNIRLQTFASNMAHITQVLQYSTLGVSLLGFAAQKDVSIGLDPLLEANSSFFYPGQNHFDLGYQPDVLQKTEKGVSRAIVSMTGALRRVWHYHHRLGPDLGLRPRDFLAVFRLMEADIEAVTCLCAWELRCQGQHFLWRHMLSQQEGDLAYVFEQSMTDNPAHAFDGTALKAVFNQWFADTARVSACDHVALEMLDAALLQSDLRIKLARRELQRADLQKIGCLPQGKNYLEGCLFTNPWYDGLEDDFNRRHLAHIEKDIVDLSEIHR